MTTNKKDATPASDNGKQKDLEAAAATNESSRPWQAADAGDEDLGVSNNDEGADGLDDDDTDLYEDDLRDK